MATAGDGAVHVWSGSRSASGVAETIGRRVAGNDCVFQSYRAGTDADAAAGTFGHETGREASSALVDTAVAGLSVVKADGCVLYVESGRIVISDCATVGKASGAVLGTSAGSTAVGFSAVAAVTTIGRVACERRGIDDQAAAIAQDCASASGPTVKRDMTAKAVRTKGIAAATASGAIQVKGGVGHSKGTETVETAATAFSAEVAAVLPCAGIAAGGCTAFECSVIDASRANDIDAATLGATTTASVLLVTGAIAPLTAVSAAVGDSRAVNVECAASEIDRTTLGI
jgi:hypothetical protein